MDILKFYDIIKEIEFFCGKVRIIMLWKIKGITKGLPSKERNTILFACEELKKYLSYMTDEQIFISESASWDGFGIALGIGLSNEIPTVKDAYFDDAILIDSSNMTLEEVTDAIICNIKV